MKNIMFAYILLSTTFYFAQHSKSHYLEDIQSLHDDGSAMNIVRGGSANGVVINEFVAQNNNGEVDEAGSFEDWIELYNNNDFSVDLSGCFLSDSPDNLVKWMFPQGTIIPENGYLIIWADNDPLDGPLHAAFRLSSLGESIILSNPDQSIVDQFDFGSQMANMASARVPNGTGDFFIQETTFGYNNESTASVDVNLSSMMNVYPNPAQSILNVNLPHELSGQAIGLYNSTGVLVYESVAQEFLLIDIQLFPSGLYFLKCSETQQKVLIVK